MNKDEIYMQRALELAQNGLGNVSPNPLVGCIIVHNDKIIGEGWHKQYGEAHAEVNAINSVKEKELLSASTLYVTLEPCSHHGKTPPCVDLIIQSKIPKVVICNVDPFKEVNGHGIKLLKESGIEVIQSVLESKGQKVNKRFFTAIEKNRPFIILKWAETKDGYIARENFDSKWISNPTSRKLVHKWRSEEDAILVGYNTVKHDDPSLTTRAWKGKDALRIIIDRDLNLNSKLNVFDNSAPTICFNTQKNEDNEHIKYIKIDFKQVEQEIMSVLQSQNVQSLIIEGGAKTLQGFIDKGLWDEACIFYCDNTFENGVTAPKINGSQLLKLDIIDDKLCILANESIV